MVHLIYGASFAVYQEEPRGCFYLHYRSYNHFQNILRLFDVSTNFPFTTREKMDNYYLQTWYIRIASRVTERLKT